MQELSPKKYIIFWHLYWLSTMGILTYVLKPNGVNYLDNFSITCVFFIITTIIAEKLFSFTSYFDWRKNTKQLWGILVVSLLFVGVPSTFELPQDNIVKILSIETYYPLFKLESSLTKLFDIFFQQVLIFCLVQYLNKKYGRKKGIYLFTLFFGALHFPLVLVFQWYSLIFIIPSLIAGFFFSSFILRLKYGLLASISLHMLYYVALGVTMRLAPLPDV